MISYDPCAVCDDGTELFVDTRADTLESAIKQFFIWANSGCHIVSAWIDVFRDGRRFKTINYWSEE